MSEKNFTFNFNAPVGQNIANVEHMDVHLDKEGQVQVMNAESISLPKEPDLSAQDHIEQEELIDGSIDLHLQLFRDAMLNVQNIKYSERRYEKLISKTYDWYAVLRLGKDLGLLNGYEDMISLMKEGQFNFVPNNPQNLNPYKQHINAEPIYPNWQFGHQSSEPFFRKFKTIADNTYSIYCLGCKQHHIRPFGPGRK